MGLILHENVDYQYFFQKTLKGCHALQSELESCVEGSEKVYFHSCCIIVRFWYFPICKMHEDGFLSDNVALYFHINWQQLVLLKILLDKQQGVSLVTSRPMYSCRALASAISGPGCLFVTRKKQSFWYCKCVFFFQKCDRNFYILHLIDWTSGMSNRV